MAHGSRGAIPDMASDQATHLQQLLEHLRRGDDSARRELVGCAYERLRLLARKILHEDFPRFENLHETGSVLDEVALRLLKALEQEAPGTVRGFFALAAKKTREVLLDLARRDRRRGGEARREGAAQAADASQSTYPDEAADSSHDPARLAQWTEFHQKVDELPQEQREVVDLHWYQGLTQAETALLLGITQKEVSRLWIKATRKLPVP
jgi:RNA polymerase sigma factor (sigma-70 family)